MKNYTKIDLGNMDAIAKLENGKAFLHDALNLTSCEISINNVPVGFKVPFNHKHIQNEEIYIVLSGYGEMLIDGEIIPLVAGTVVRVSPDAVRTIANTGTDPLQFICVQARAASLEQFGFGDGVVC